jgi:hypothetical protein
MKAKYFVLSIVILFFFTNNSINAQDSTKKLQGKLHKVIKEKVKEKLKLDDSTSEKFNKMYDEYQIETRELNKTRIKLYKYIESNLNSDDISTKLDELLNNETKIQKTHEKYIENLKTIFTSKQLATLLVFSQKVKKLLRNEIGKRKNLK